MIHLSKRLRMIADMVSSKMRVADIGCDHAHISIYLAMAKKTSKVIAMDINEGPLLRAKANILRYGCQNTIETRRSDGAKELLEGEADTLIISGMGGALIVQILKKSESVIKGMKELILQPQSEPDLVRHCLHDLSFRIEKEEMVYEDGAYYTAILAKQGKESYELELFYLYGKYLLTNKDKTLFRYLTQKKKKFEMIIVKLDEQEYDRKKQRYQELLNDVEQLNQSLFYYNTSFADETGKRRSMDKIKVWVDGEEKEYDSGTTFLTIAKEVSNKYSDDIILASLDGDLRELNAKLLRGGNIEFITTKNGNGLKTYTRGITMVLMKAAYHVIGKDRIKRVSMEHSLGPGYYGEIEMEGELTAEILTKIELRMKRLVEKNLPFHKASIHTRDAMERFRIYKMDAKVKLFRYRRVSQTNIYSLGGFEDYFFGYMPPNTGMLQYFKLIPYKKGFILQLPTLENPRVVPDFIPREKLFLQLREASKWGQNMHIFSVGELNDVIAMSGMSDLILVQEALQEKKIGEIAEQISKLPNKKFIMVAGPSSSGKTTFSHRLSIQLRTFGLNPHPIGVDDYFLNRDDTPKNEDGSYNFECLEAIDVLQFNKDMTALLNQETVELPSFNFKTGKREYKGNYKKLGANDILVIEGIHGLNDMLSYALPEESKFKVYISALTTLNIDEHNQISTSDGRLIRRMVRDARTRGSSAGRTIGMWKSVRNGEEKYIFPFQESADVMFNSALIYELAVLKQFAEPILFNIEESEPSYPEAKRLLKFLDYFVGVSSEDIPRNSILREFIGNSYFNV